MNRMAIVAALVGIHCGAELDGGASALSPNDPLYARAKAECGQSLLLRAVDADQEAICCLDYDHGLIPQLHCMTASGKTVQNPTDVSKLKR